MKAIDRYLNRVMAGLSKGHLTASEVRIARASFAAGELAPQAVEKITAEIRRSTEGL